MKKSVVFALIICISFAFLLSSVFVYAEKTEDEQIEDAYDWLEDQVRGNWQDLIVKEHVFSLLALSCNDSFSDSGEASLKNKAFIGNGIKCWGVGPENTRSESNCKIVETALVKLAFDQIDEETEEIRNWLIAQNITQVSGIRWFLQIDVKRGENATCSVIYGDQEEEKIFKINPNKTVELLGTTSCFRRVHKNYWFEIEQTRECYSNMYTIKCWSDDEVFRASLLYKKENDDVWHVSSETKTGISGVPGKEQAGGVDLKVSSYCLANPGKNECDYEGTAWAAYVLDRQGEGDHANLFIPYLIVFESQNVKWFPESFLYQITGQQKYGDAVRDLQNPAGSNRGFWLIQPKTYERVYDTAHAGLALMDQGTGQEEIEKAKNYLLTNQEINGNLVSNSYGSGKNSIRDTAFALWVFWSHLCSRGGIGGDCEDAGFEYTCRDDCFGDEIEVGLDCGIGELCCKFVGSGADCVSAGGSCKLACDPEDGVEISMECPSGNVCCRSYEDMECSEAGGQRCSFGEVCEGTSVFTGVDQVDCCLGSCAPEDISNMNCVDAGGIICSSNKVCINYDTWFEVPFKTSLDSDLCCVGERVKCVQDVTCTSLGGERCFAGECIGTMEETKDVEDCCVGSCLESCSAQQGTICVGEQQCSVSYIDASDSLTCCPSYGECRTGRSNLVWLWVFIVVIVIIAGLALYYFLKVKGKKKPKKRDIFGMPPISRVPPTRPRPGSRPGPPMRPMPPRPRGVERPVPRPVPRPRPGPGPRRTARARTRALPKPPRVGKTSEDELEKTLKKLEKMAKEK